MQKGILRITVFLFLFGICHFRLSAQDISRQIILPKNELTGRELIALIEKSQSVQFTFGKEADDRLNRKLSFKGTSLTIKETLEVMKRSSGLSYSITNTGAIILKAEAMPATNNPPAKKKGTVSGIITDEENGESLQGVSVRIGQLTVLSGVDGDFKVSLGKGVYTGLITSVGYGSKQITDINISDNQAFELNVVLKREKGSMAGVVVSASAKKETVAALYARQKNAPGISDGISSEQIARTPDKNIGEVLKRVSGVSIVDNRYVVVRGLSERYNGSMLNNQLMPSTELNRKQFSFDIIPSSLIDNVVVYKTITPDMNAEFGGGLVSVNTKAIPAEDFLILTVGGSVNDKTTGKTFKGLQIEDKEYLGAIPDNRKLMGQGDWGSRSEVVKSFDRSLFPNNWALYNYDPKPSLNYQLSGGKAITLKKDRRIGLMGAVSYRNTWQTQDVLMSRGGFEGSAADGVRYAFTGNRYGFTTNTGILAGAGYQDKISKISWQGLYLNTLDQQLIFGTGSHVPVGTAVGYFDIFTQTKFLQQQLKGEHALGRHGIKFNWAGSYINLDKQKPDNHIMIANYSGEGGDSPLDPVDFSITGAQSGTVDGALRTWSRAKEKNLSWNTDISIPFRFNAGKISFVNSFKTGYAGWSKERSFWVVNTGSGFNTGKFQPLTEYFDSTLHAGSLNPLALNQFGDDMHKTAALHAGYLMMDNKIARKWRLVWGLRAEFFNLNKVNQALDSTFSSLNSGKGISDQFDYSDLRNMEPNWNFFPSANLTYNLTPGMNLRLAYSKSIIRPDLREVSYFREYDFELGGTYESMSPIRSTRIHHYDFRYEWYPSAGEVFSVSLFYKKLDYPMEIFKIGDNRQYELRNSRSAENKGIEVELRKSFAFTGIPVIKNITIYGNATWMDASVVQRSVEYKLTDTEKGKKVTISERLGAEEKRPQAGASNFMANAGLYYDSKIILLSATYNFVSNRMFRPDVTYRHSLYEQPLRSLDVQIAVNLLKKKMQVKLNAGNLLGSKSLVYRNFYEEGPVNSGTESPSTKELLYNKGKDVIDYQGAPGRTYSCTVSYRF